MKQKDQVSILVADDDLDDCEMIREAFQESHLLNGLTFVHDGEELMTYLNHQKNCQDPQKKKLPGLILLDLNMPKKHGFEAIQEIKADPQLRHIPVVVLTTSQAEEDIYRTYDLGVNSYIIKPVAFNKLVEVLAGLGRYWLQIVELPENSGNSKS